MNQYLNLDLNHPKVSLCIVLHYYGQVDRPSCFHILLKATITPSKTTDMPFLHRLSHLHLVTAYQLSTNQVPFNLPHHNHSSQYFNYQSPHCMALTKFRLISVDPFHHDIFWILVVIVTQCYVLP